ncbi:hypothetical protein TorRG33x02_054670, partial [Trema orientale]
MEVRWYSGKEHMEHEDHSVDLAKLHARQLRYEEIMGDIQASINSIHNLLE